MVLGFFSFNKLLMYKDLDPEEWPEEDGLLEKGIIQALFEDGFKEPQSEIGDEVFIDDHLKAEDAFHVVDADSSQAKAIYDVNRGRSMVIQGLPGTGKSQTITNVIAESVAQGKTVLFVAEKMAALEVVKHRLDSIGLGDACLELHSRKTQKRAVIDEFKRTLELGEPDTEGIEDDFVTLNEIRDRLNEYATAVNAPVGDTGITPHDAYGKLVGIMKRLDVVAFPRLRVDGIDFWTGGEFQRKLDVVAELQTLLGRLGVPKDHIFRGSGLKVVTPLEQADIRGSLHAATESLDVLRGLSGRLASLLGQHEPENVSQLSLLLPLAERAQDAPDIRGINLKALRFHARRNDVRELSDRHQQIVDIRREWDPLLYPGAWRADMSEEYALLSSISQAEWKTLLSPEYLTARIRLSELQRTGGPKDVDSLNTLAKLAGSLSELLGLDAPESTVTAALMIPLAEHAAESPNIKGLNLSALDPHETRSEIRELPVRHDRRTQLHSEFDSLLKTEAWDASLSEEYDILTTTGRSFLGRLLSPAYRRSRRRVSDLCLTTPPTDVEGYITLVEAILEEQHIRRDLVKLERTAESVLGNRWQGEHSDWEAIEDIIEWALALLEDVDSGKVDSELALAMSNELDSKEIGDVLTVTREALKGHRIVAQVELTESSTLRQLALGKAITEEQRASREFFDTLGETAEAVLGDQWDGVDSDWEAIGVILKWLVALLNDIDDKKIRLALALNLNDEVDTITLTDTLIKAEATLESLLQIITDVETALHLDNERQFGEIGGLNTMPFAEQRDVLIDWLNGIAQLRDMANFNSIMSTANGEGLDAIVEVAWEWEKASEQLSQCFEYARYTSTLSRAILERSSLAEFNTDVHSDRIARFREMDELALEHNRARVSYEHSLKMPKYQGLGQLGILHREFAKRRRHLPIRQLMDQAGNAIQAIKPVYMMSPLSVATYLKPGGLEFDLVIFDEASQVKPVDALGALVRADQSVVVGDDRQLPPTDFFNTVNQDEDDDSESVPADMESILSLYSAQGAPNRMLQWHYSSRHDSLIAVSNREFYDNRLIVFPSPDSRSEGAGLQYHWLDTQYQRGGVNPKEAEQVAKAVMEHAREHPELTLGVATFSVKQRDSIQDALEILRQQDDSSEAFFDSHPDEPFFVKNLENVQGDERDVIFISVGYGRNSSGRVLQNFGPLNREGGERRLNVLISRAKQRCEVFTNLRADDIRLTASSRQGVLAFKRFLAYADSGEIGDLPTASGRDYASPFQAEVADSIRSRGYEAHDEIASGGFFVDIGVADTDRPGRYVLGIECDGAAYHSSRSARERDRLRESVLKGLGWRMHRIWSTDYFNNPERELERTIHAIEEALLSQREGDESQSGPAPTESLERGSSIRRSEIEENNRAVAVKPYELAQPIVSTWPYELGDAPISQLREPIIEVVEVESPVHEDELIRRVTNSAGLRRVGRKIQTNVSYAIDVVVGRGEIVRNGNFLWSKNMKKVVVRDRGELDAQQKKIECISPEELAEAVSIVVVHSYGIERNDIATPTVRLLGFKSASTQMKDAIDAIAADMLEDGRLNSYGVHLTPG